MIALDSQIQTALEQRLVVARDFVWFTVKDRVTGLPYSEGYWSDLVTVSAIARSPVLGEVTRTWFGAGALISIGGIVRSASPVVQSVEITLSQLDDRIDSLIRGYEPKQGKIEIYRGLFDPATNDLIVSGFPRFYGFIDEIVVTTPSENGEGSITVTCRSQTQEFSRSNPSIRSDADQRRRSATDNFFQDVSTAGELEVWWGQVQK